MEDTAKSNFAGGDTNWEEEKLGSYANRYVASVQLHSLLFYFFLQ